MASKTRISFTEGSKIRQILCAFLINLCVFSYGTSIGWMSPMTLVLQSKDSPADTPFSDTEISIMGSLPYFMSIPANVMVGYLGDSIGRKIALLLSSASAMCVWIIKLSIYDSWAYILARSLIGIHIAGCYVVAPAYIKEISDDCIRGALCSLIVLFHTSGNLFLYIIGDLVSYRTVLWICFAIPTIHIVVFILMPESPSFLVKKGKDKEAVKAIAWLRCRREDDAAVLQELELIKKEQLNDEGSSGFVLKAILKDKIIFRAFRIALIASLAREVCGAIPVTNYAGEIFTMSSEGSSLVFTPNQQAMLLGAVQVAGSSLGSSVVENVGRKTLLFITSLVSGFSMCVLASWFLAKDYNLTGVNWLPVVTLCICIFCDSSGLLPASVVLTGEMFSFKYRGTVMATTMSIASLAGFLQMLFFKPLITAVGIHFSFYFFGITCLLASIYVLLVVPETKKRRLEEIYWDLRTKKEKIEDDFVMKDVTKV